MTAGITVGEALSAFRRRYGLAADETTHTTWSCRLGPVTLRLPNWQWRRRAVLAHDLHHLLTGIPCTMRGEFQMAAWEFGAGPMPHWGARVFCLPLLLFGLIWSPGRTFSAFRAGRRGRTLHRLSALDAVLATPLEAARAAFAPPAHDRASIADQSSFAALVVEASVLLLGPVAIAFGIWFTLAAA